MFMAYNDRVDLDESETYLGEPARCLGRAKTHVDEQPEVVGTYVNGVAAAAAAENTNLTHDRRRCAFCRVM